MSSPATFRIRVLGCRVNHAERRELESFLRSRGLCEAAPGHDADLEVVHTCSVTTRAAAKSRQLARRANRAQASTLLITGCMAATHPDQAAAITGDHAQVICHTSPMPHAVAEWFDRTHGTDTTPTPPKSAGPIIPLPLVTLPNAPAQHVRAEVRIQEGCDAYCTFCIIPKTRPELRTKSISTVLDEVSRLVELGHKEVVLAGIFLGAYGHETALRRKQSNPQAEPLAELVDAVATVPGLTRLRLSSLEPGDCSDALLEAYTRHPDVLVPHFHLPLQSGADRVLKRMNRQYRVNDYLDMVERVNNALTRDDQRPTISTDIICGFPGETESDFQQTIDIARQVEFLHMHVFPYSTRPGTAAARWNDIQVPHETRAERVSQLIQLESGPDGLCAQNLNRLILHPLRILAEQPDPDRPGHWLGRCDRGGRVSVKTPAQRGEMIRANGQRIEDDVIVAVPNSVSLPMCGVA